MREVELVPGLRTSALGFGTAGLGARLPERARRRLLDAAFDAGIRHVDTAPLYGDGTAEASVGRFLAGKRDAVTVAAKVGLAPPRGGPAAPLLRRLGAAAARPVGPDEGRASLERTLRRLRTDRVDLLLLHECRADDPLLDAWRAFLDEAVTRGEARATGIAATPPETARILAATAGGSFPEVVQVAAGAVSVPPERGAVFHSVFAGGSSLRAAAAEHPHAVVLFFSGRVDHIEANAAQLDSPA